MNTKNVKYIQFSSLILILLSFFVCDQGRCQTEQTFNQLKQLSSRIGQAQASIPHSTMDDMAKEFTSILPAINFDPNYQKNPTVEENTPNGVIEIKEATKIALALITSNQLKTGIEKNIGSSSVAAIDTFLVKLKGAIDPNWKSMPVSANVMPPSGTPNAAAGMNPEAIKDPNLKKQYLDLIKNNRDNNLKNGQQRALRESRDRILKAIAGLVSVPGEGLSKDDVMARFCKDEQSKIILENYLKQNQ